MVIGVRGTVASAATAVVVGLGAFAAPAALAAPTRPGSRPARPSSRDGPPPAAPPCTRASSPTPPAAVPAPPTSCSPRATGCSSARRRTARGRARPTETDGCSSATGPLGTEVAIQGSDGRDRKGAMAYSSWVAMQADGETDPDLCAYNDFALVELSTGDAADVNPSVPFFGGPTGLHERALSAGTPVLGYGNSTTRHGVEALRPKAGSIVAANGKGFGYEVYTVSPGIPGDSGSGYLTQNGEAVGVLSTLNLAPLPVSNGMTNLAKALRYAADHGFADLELEPGTGRSRRAPRAPTAGADAVLHHAAAEQGGDAQVG